MVNIGIDKNGAVATLEGGLCPLILAKRVEFADKEATAGQQDASRLGEDEM